MNVDAGAEDAFALPEEFFLPEDEVFLPEDDVLLFCCAIFYLDILALLLEELLDLLSRIDEVRQ